MNRIQNPFPQAVRAIKDRGDQAQLLEEVSAKLSILCQYQQSLVQRQINEAKARVAEEQYFSALPTYGGVKPDYSSLPQFSSGSTTYGADIARQTNNTFEVRHIVIAAGSAGNFYLILGKRTIFLTLSKGVPWTARVKMPLSNADTRTILTQSGATQDIFVGLYGVQEGDAMSIG